MHSHLPSSYVTTTSCKFSVYSNLDDIQRALYFATSMQYEDQIMRFSTPQTQDMQCAWVGVFLGLKSLLDIYFCERSCFVCRLLWIGFVLCHQHKKSQKRSEARKLGHKILICQRFNLLFKKCPFFLPLRILVVSNVRQPVVSRRRVSHLWRVFDFCVARRSLAV